jgi:hypothetical protein
MADLDTTKTFKSDPLNFSGYENQRYRNGLLQLAFTKPSEYYKLQDEVLAKLLEDNIKSMYNTVYNVLRSGKNKDKGVVVDITGYDTYAKISPGGWDPKIPDQECDSIAKSIIQDFQKSLENKVIDLVLPPNIFDQALNRSAKKAAAGIDDSSTT